MIKYLQIEQEKCEFDGQHDWCDQHNAEPTSLRLLDRQWALDGSERTIAQPFVII